MPYVAREEEAPNETLVQVSRILLSRLYETAAKHTVFDEMVLAEAVAKVCWSISPSASSRAAQVGGKRSCFILPAADGYRWGLAQTMVHQREVQSKASASVSN